MEIIDVEIEEPIKIAMLGDFHLGLSACFEEKVFETFDKLAKTDKLVIGMGDYCECRKPDDRHFDSVETIHSIEEQLNIVFAQFRKVNTLGLLVGNHEDRFIRNSTENPIRRWCEDNNSYYLGDMALFRFLYDDGDMEGKYRLIVHHGHGGGKKPGSKVNNMNDFLGEHDVDAGFTGHNHQLLNFIRTEMEYDNGVPQARYKQGGFTGTFLLTYKDGSHIYSQKKMYPPLPTGYMECTIDPDDTPLRGLKFEEVIV